MTIRVTDDFVVYLILSTHEVFLDKFNNLNEVREFMKKEGFTYAKMSEKLSYDFLSI